MIEKRYSEFDDLYKNLKKVISNIPALPGKTLFKIISNEAIDKRRQELDLFLKVSI